MFLKISGSCFPHKISNQRLLLFSDASMICEETAVFSKEMVLFKPSPADANGKEITITFYKLDFLLHLYDNEHVFIIFTFDFQNSLS